MECGGGKRVVLFDRGINETSSIVIFRADFKATKIDINGPLVICGTFKIVPPGYFQPLTALLEL